MRLCLMYTKFSEEKVARAQRKVAVRAAVVGGVGVGGVEGR